MRILSPEETLSVTRHIRVYGYAILKAALSPDEVKSYKSIVLQHFNQNPNKFEGTPSRDHRDKIIYNLQNKHKSFIDLASSPSLSQILKEFLNDKYYRLLEPEYPNYILNYYNARSSGEKLDLHIDSHIPSSGDNTWAMQAVFALDKFTATNGATVIVPGSHLSGKYSDRSMPFSDMMVIKAEAGDLIFWDSRLWHGTEPNTCGSDRWALVATFTMWWLKQAMDITRGLPNEIYQEITPEQKRLLGFCSIPPRDESERINTKQSYDDLKQNVYDYYK